VTARSLREAGYLLMATTVCFLNLPCYTLTMTKLLDDALEAARRLPPEMQDTIARVVLWLAGADDEAPVALSAGERTAIADSKEAVARGEFATDAQVRATWAKHGL
jgi:hypothetical protein